MVRSSIAIMCMILCMACSRGINAVQEEPGLVFDKFLGTWKLDGEEQYEQWRKNENGSYSSRMFTVSGKDTTIREEVKIVPEDGKWNFITIVKGQNKGKAVLFTSSVLMDSLVQFENPAHDFPRIINYRLSSSDTLSAFISGTSDTIYFHFSRVSPK